MSSEMLMRPYEQSFNVMSMNNMYYHQYNNSMIENNNGSMYYSSYPHQIPVDLNENLKTAFYNPFEIKHRRRTSRSQLKVLESSFEENHKPNAAVRRLLAQKLDMTPRGVQIWFQNRRAKAKLQRRKSGEDDQPQPKSPPTLFNPFYNVGSYPSVIKSSSPDYESIHPTSILKTSPAEYNSIHPSSLLKSSLHDYHPSKWTRHNSVDTFSHINCSPASQELTPMLSTGSPVSSLDGAYYESCLDLLITSSPVSSSPL